MRGKRARAIRKLHQIKHVRQATAREPVEPTPHTAYHQETRSIPKETR